ncbi:nucleoside hydrolase [Coraliomargarita parva]|uniref:nucleoside hydrolase n=1 Tax=Coraliomargarita parva TaxID=3014050 RepID=UPI0022B5C567|nr:nucleoside hydrolase [Coraliomargarita parva]
MHRRSFISGTLAGIGSAALAACQSGQKSPPIQGSLQRKPIPVIYDSDIGGDIDDTWALHMLLRSPEVDIKLLASDSDNTIFRARLMAKLLDYGGYAHIPVAIGMKRDDKPDAQSGWLGNYQLEDYPGTVHQDAVDAIIQTIHSSPDPVTLICVGPMPNIGEALKRDPGIVKNARFVGMYGSIYEGYTGTGESISAEWNVQQSHEALQAVFEADWDCTITPIDSCQHVVLKGDLYRKVRRSKDPLAKDLMANYDHWIRDVKWLKEKMNPETESSILYDTVAVHLAYSTRWLKMKKLPLRVDAKGFTRIDEAKGHLVNCAVGWTDMAAFESDLVARLTRDG